MAFALTPVADRSEVRRLLDLPELTQEHRYLWEIRITNMLRTAFRHMGRVLDKTEPDISNMAVRAL